MNNDFNHTNLKKVLPKFYQHVTVPTRGDNILNQVYTNAQGADRAFSYPYLGGSHSAVMLVPSYQPLWKREKSVSRVIRGWSDGATSALEDCSDCTNLLVFREYIGW